MKAQSDKHIVGLLLDNKTTLLCGDRDRSG